NTVPAEKVSAPLIAGCVAWLECRIIPEVHNQQSYDLFVAEVVAAWADERVFRDGRWHFAKEEWRTLHYLSGDRFLVSGQSFEIS
ncbi:MAG TPA: flavin reductase family protein, partial [Accumulibacter sp.]|nr:flavin reductase family protein [Accumulibacter sp.]